MAIYQMPAFQCGECGASLMPDKHNVKVFPNKEATVRLFDYHLNECRYKGHHLVAQLSPVMVAVDGLIEEYEV